MKRELIDKKKLIKDLKESNAISIAERMKFSNVVEHQKLITEEQIVKLYIDKLVTEIKADIKEMSFLTDYAAEHDTDDRCVHLDDAYVIIDEAVKDCINE